MRRRSCKNGTVIIVISINVVGAGKHYELSKDDEMMDFDPQKIMDAANYAAHKYCPKEYLKEDAASAAILKIVERIPEYDASKASAKTFLIQQARYGVADFLRREFGRMSRGNRKIDMTVCDEYEDTHVGNTIPSDSLLDIARRLDNTEAVPDPTVAQWRGNLPELKTLRQRSV